MVCLTCISILLSVFFNISNSHIRVLLFKEKFITKNSVAFNGIKKEFKSRNTFTCAEKCLLNEKCKSYFFNKLSKTCVIQGKIFDVSMDTHYKDWTYCYTTNKEVKEEDCVTEMTKYDFEATRQLWLHWFYETAEECRKSCLEDKRCVFFIFNNATLPSKCTGIYLYYPRTQTPHLYKDCRAKGYYQSPCNHASSCKFEGAVCQHNKCVCPVLYQFDMGRRKCTRRCPNFSDDTVTNSCRPYSKNITKQCVSEEKVSVSNPLCTNWHRIDPYPGKKFTLWSLNNYPSISSCHESCLKDVRCIRFAISDDKRCIGLGEDGKEKESTLYGRKYEIYLNCRFPGYLNVACYSSADCCFKGARCTNNKCLCNEGYFHQGKRACLKQKCRKCGQDLYLISRVRSGDDPVAKAEIEKCSQSKKDNKSCSFIYMEKNGTCETFDVDENETYDDDDGNIFARTCLSEMTDDVFPKVGGFVKAPSLPCPSTRAFYTPQLIDKLHQKQLWMINIEDGDESRCEKFCLMDERCVVWLIQDTVCRAYSEHYKGRPWGVRAGIHFNKNCRA